MTNMDCWNSSGENVTMMPFDAWTTALHTNKSSQVVFTPELVILGLMIRRICYLTFFCATSVIAPIGIICNTFAIVVFLSAANFRRTSTVQYLIGLAITDSLYLLGELLYTWSTPTPWATYLTSINFVYRTDFGCKSIMWLRYRSQEDTFNDLTA
jgi:riboflavin transporter FmnP